jgi:hypothetical protein
MSPTLQKVRAQRFSDIEAYIETCECERLRLLGCFDAREDVTGDGEVCAAESVG